MVENRRDFAMTPSVLINLMQLRELAAVVKIKEFGGITGLYRGLITDPSGIPNSREELKRRRDVFGTNYVFPLPPKSFFSLILAALRTITVNGLFFVGVVLFALSFYKPGPAKVEGGKGEQETGRIESVAILLCVSLVLLVRALMDYITERHFKEIETKINTNHKVVVIRGGQQLDVMAKELVVGDIMKVKYGDVLTADGVLIQCDNLKIDESSLTGESVQKKSVDKDPMLLSGTHVVEGSGRMVVTAVGVNSQTGINKARHGGSKLAIKEQSVLHAKLTLLSIQIGHWGSFVATYMMFILVVRFCIQNYVLDKKSFMVSDCEHFANFLLIGVTVLVVAVPEGLPMAVTLSLAYSVKKMMKDNSVVRHLGACEAMANATAICLQTGTLTTNRMSVVQSYLNETHYKETPPQWERLHLGSRDLLVQCISINSSYSSQVFPPKKTGEQMQQLGDRTECGLLGFVLGLGQSYQAVREAFPEQKIFKAYTCNSVRESMSTVIELKGTASTVGYRVFSKGASEILQKCKWILGRNGELSDLTGECLDRLMREVVDPMASDGLRPICLAYKDYKMSMTLRDEENQLPFDGGIDWDDESAVISGLTVIAIVGIQNPVRPEVPEAIEKCQQSGIVIRIVTDDNINTTREIASACGILKPGEDFLALDGEEFNRRVRNQDGEVSQEKLDRVWPKLRILASAQPTDKSRLIKGIIDSKLNAKREVVAMVSGGTNDGTVLKEADVGLAMGDSGTDVAREASGIILTDDNFMSVVKAVMWGRNVYDSAAKFLQFQLTANFVAIIVVFVGACAIQNTPLKAVQMLCVNLIMDTMFSVALATELPTENLMKRKASPLVSHTVMNIFGHAVYQLTVLFTLIFAGSSLFGIASGLSESLYLPPTQHFTIVFNTFVMMTLFNQFNCRKVHGDRNVFQGLFTNPIYCTIWMFTLVVQFVIVEFGGRWFSTEPLTLNQWFWCLALGAGSLLWEQFLLSVPAKSPPNIQMEPVPAQTYTFIVQEEQTPPVILNMLSSSYADIKSITETIVDRKYFELLSEKGQRDNSLLTVILGGFLAFLTAIITAGLFLYTVMDQIRNDLATVQADFKFNKN